MFAADYRAYARSALKGKWKNTIGIFFLAGLVLNGLGIDIVLRRFSGIRVQSLMLAGQEYKISFAVPQGFGWVLYILSMMVTLFGLITLVGSFRVCRTVAENQSADWHTMFPLRMLGKVLVMNLLRAILLVAGYMLLFVPGLVLTFAYTMADYLLAENPDMGPVQALRESRLRMRGRKWPLFCLELSYIGWMLLSSLAIWLAASLFVTVFGDGYFASILQLLTGALINACLDVYISMGETAFFMQAQRPFVENHAADEPGEAAYAEQQAEQSSADAEAEDNAAAAQELYMQYHCSRKLIRAAGLEEDYEKMGLDSASEARLRRDYGDSLMSRFDRDPEALNDILSLVNEYRMDALLDRAMMRIDRHIRQDSLDADMILDMCGRALLAAVSGAFADREAYVQRKKDQISDMLDRLDPMLSAEDGSSERLGMIRNMCR